MNKGILFSIVIAMLFPSVRALAGIFGPSNFDECVLQSMKGVTSDAAARIIARACRNKFPENPKENKKTRELSEDELRNVHGRAGHDWGTHFGGNLYNGNSKVTITQVLVIVVTKLKGKETSRREYLTDVKIQPQTTASFGFEFVVGEAGSDYSWGIIGGRGY